MMVFKKVYRITGEIPDEVKHFNKPYLLLSNHYGRYDPFIVSDFLRKKPNFISSDAILRDPIIGRLFKGLGAIPKKKGIRDTQVIREMLRVIKQGGALGLFPEGTRTWSGVTHPLEPSVAKLIRILDVTVITAKMKGAYAFDPRWARPLRRARVKIDFTLAIPKHELAHLEEEETMAIIKDKLYHDDVAYIKENSIKIKSNKRAEYIERILFQCPGCKNYEGFSSIGNGFTCNCCSYSAKVNEQGMFSSTTNTIKFDNPRDWLNWQNENFIKWVTSAVEQGIKTSIFQATNMDMQVAIGNQRMIPKGICSISFYHDRIQVDSGQGEEHLFHSEINSLGPQFNERIELFYKDRAYRFTSTKHQEPGIKWELAINCVWHKNSEFYKMSSYFNYLFTDM